MLRKFSQINSNKIKKVRDQNHFLHSNQTNETNNHNYFFIKLNQVKISHGYSFLTVNEKICNFKIWPLIIEFVHVKITSREFPPFLVIKFSIII
jgi:hypothetical protein